MPRRSPQNKIGVQHERFGAIMYTIFSAAEAREAYTQRDGDMTDAELRRGLRTICWRPTAAALFRSSVISGMERLPRRSHPAGFGADLREARCAYAAPGASRLAQHLRVPAFDLQA